MKHILKLTEWATKLTRVFQYVLVIVAAIEALQFFASTAKKYVGENGWESFKSKMGVDEIEKDLASAGTPDNSNTNENDSK